MTSVKQFRVEQDATADSLGRGAFVFTDAYSVFDWGQMPDPIPDKGASLCTMGAFTFEALERAGIETHYRGVIEEGTVCDLDATTRPPREMAIDLTQVPPLPQTADGYDYDAYHAAAGSNYLVPLEIVFRNRVPVGSSLRRRTGPADHGLAYDDWPDEPIDLPDPVIEFSTKYEASDRYLERSEADAIAGRAALSELETIARSVNRVITDRAADVGMVHEDGKIECLYHDGTVVVADVAGTFDENRFRYNGTQLSKELLRQHHKRTQPEWVDALETAKSEASSGDGPDWKRLCSHTPDPLDPGVVEAAANVYRSGTNQYTGRTFFDAPPLADLVADLETGL